MQTFGAARQTATAQLHVLAEFLEATQVNRVFRIANWRWASKWDQGLADPGEVRSRLTVVFPTVITAARMYRAAGRRLHSSALAAETHSIEHLGCWCTDFMQQPGVAAFLSKRGEAPEAPKLLSRRLAVANVASCGKGSCGKCVQLWQMLRIL